MKDNDKNIQKLTRWCVKCDYKETDEKAKTRQHPEWCPQCTSRMMTERGNDEE